MKIFVIRHGEVDVNIYEGINGRNTSSLTEKGIKQANEAIKDVRALPIDLIICSPLKRTIETCKIINTLDIPVIYDERILERDAKSMMYKVTATVDLNVFYDPDAMVIFKDCEGFGSIVERVKSFLEDIKKNYYDKNILIVTHNDVCKAIRCVINNNYDINEIINFNQNNCEILEYEIGN